jgi:hypothetical protein
VSLRERVVRSNSGAPISSSMRRMDSLSDGCEMPSRCAAALKLSESAAAARTSSCRWVKFIGQSYVFIGCHYLTL